VERTLADLERDRSDVAGIRYLRAAFYMRSMNSEPAAQRSGLLRKAIDTLSTLSAQGNSLYHRKALATLASLYFSERDYANARATFRRYLDTYPLSAWAWVAALRVGQCDDALSDWKAAVDPYLVASSKHSSVPIARVLGHAYAARDYEALGQFDRALREDRRALEGWDQDYGLVYSLDATHAPRSNEPFPVRENTEIATQAMANRIDQLSASISVSGGSLLERGRWLVDHGRYRDALAPLGRLVTRYPQSPAVPEARYLAHRARLGDALELSWARNPFSRRSSVPFAIINPDVSVKFPHAETTRVSVYRSLPGTDQVLFLNAEQRAVFISIIVN
jgi:tetratricopeptide (TPR) repeat protein